MQSKIRKIRDLYALLSLSNPDLIQPYKSHMTKQDIVAAKLIAANHAYDATTTITSIDGKEYKFAMDLNSITHQSKDDLIWVTHIEVIHLSETLVSISINPRMIDIPYTGNKVCAHWLLRNINKEPNETLNSSL